MSIVVILAPMSHDCAAAPRLPRASGFAVHDWHRTLGLERRVVASLDAAPSRVPVVLGGCGTGRTTLLHALTDRFGRTSCQYIDVERSASTPERFHDAVLAASPFVDPAAAH